MAAKREGGGSLRVSVGSPEVEKVWGEAGEVGCPVSSPLHARRETAYFPTYLKLHVGHSVNFCRTLL